MVLQKWDPHGELNRFDSLFDRLWRGVGRVPVAQGSYSWTIPVDVVEEPGRIVVSASLPGLKPEEISVSVDSDVLTIEAETSSRTEESKDRDGGSYVVRERRHGAFRRSMRLPKTVDQDKIESRYENGVLTVELPKPESRKPKAIEVKAA